MRHSKTDEGSDERWAKLSARVNLTTALLAHSEANLARSLAKIERRRQRKRRLTAPVRLLRAWIRCAFRANR
jgi:hypothetical protein